MMAVSMVRVRCSGCATEATIAVGTFERGTPCRECGGGLEPIREVTKTYGHGLCSSGKYRFDSHGAGLRAQRAHRRKVGKACAVYRCESCRGWHLGSSLGRTG